ncbi:MAG: glycosyltransferase family 4 protein [Acidobacteria bacterium]|nr:glycosyltransferase family 4 protein [Acidobacteriota bacterium]
MNRTEEPIRLAYIVSHPIQYQAPLLRRIAAEPDIDLTVFFSSDFSVRTYHDEGFGTELKWDVDLLSGYKHDFLPRMHSKSSLSSMQPVSYGIFRRLRKGKFDAVWVHGYATWNAIHAILAANALGIPVLVRNDGWLGDRPRSRKTLLAKSMFLAVLRKLIDGVLTAGTLNAEYWSAYMDDVPQFLMPYAVDNAYFAERTAAAASTQKQLRADLQLADDRPVILFASKLQTRKHCNHLLEAYFRMPEPRPYLVIVGNGEERIALEQRVAEKGCDTVRFAGFRNQSELPRFFNLASVFVLPARHEPWGLIVNEAMSASLPVIVTDEVGAAPDLVKNGINGFIYPFGDIEALQRALQYVLQSPEKAAEMGRNSYQKIETWDFDRNVVALRTALMSVTGRSVPCQNESVL